MGLADPVTERGIVIAQFLGDLRELTTGLGDQLHCVGLQLINELAPNATLTLA
jgi:hypothetical protein